jgi:predicted O-methyltransferase YrrM
MWCYKNGCFTDFSSHPIKILEIGSFEGLSSVWIAENMLNDSASSMVCVDPFLTCNNDHSDVFTNKTEQNFLHNISVCKNGHKIKVMKMISDDFFKVNTDVFDFIHVDGCHEPDVIVRDMESSFKVLKVGGIMWCDDYLGGPDVPDDQKPIKKAMDEWLNTRKENYNMIFNGYQIAIKKTSNADET